jgi:hypothetical protein
MVPTSNPDCVFHNNYSYRATLLIDEIYQYIDYDSTSGNQVREAIKTMDNKRIVEWLQPVVDNYKKYTKLKKVTTA